MGKVSFVSGVVLIALSGILYTAEKYLYVFSFASKVSLASINDNAFNLVQPNSPEVFDNFFVGFFLILGLALLVFGIIQYYKNPNARR